MGGAVVCVVDREDKLMTPGEVALLFRVDPKTVTRWATSGRMDSIKTPGGHRRFRTSTVMEFLSTAGLDGSSEQDVSHAASGLAVA